MDQLADSQLAKSQFIELGFRINEGETCPAGLRRGLG